MKCVPSSVKECDDDIGSGERTMEYGIRAGVSIFVMMDMFFSEIRVLRCIVMPPRAHRLLSIISTRRRSERLFIDRVCRKMSDGSEMSVRICNFVFFVAIIKNYSKGVWG